jgi:hypothetical protein
MAHCVGWKDCRRGYSDIGSSASDLRANLGYLLARLYRQHSDRIIARLGTRYELGGGGGVATRCIVFYNLC